MSPCTTYYDIIIRQERLSEELGTVINATNMKLPADRGPSHVVHSHSDHGMDIRSSFKETMDALPIPQRNKLKEIYKLDLQVFGYSWNVKTNFIDGF